MPCAGEGFLATGRNGAHSPAKDAYTDWNIINKHLFRSYSFKSVKLFKNAFCACVLRKIYILLKLAVY